MLQTSLDNLEGAALIRRAQVVPELTYWFRHGLVQETTYESILKHDRKRLHRFIADSLEREYPDVLDELALLLAQHWDEAGELARAFTYYLRAGENYARVYANAEAVVVFERARELARALDLSSELLEHLYASRGRVHELRGEYEDALANYQEQENLALARNDAALELDALARRATLFVTPNKLFDFDKGLDLSERALQLARAAGDRPAEAKVLWNLLMLYGNTGHYAKAIEYGEASLALARALDLREQMAYTLNDLAGPYALMHRSQDALRTRAEAQALWRELGNLPMLADTLSRSGEHALLFGDYSTGFPWVEEALRISREIGNLWGQADASETLAFMYLERCELDKALTHFQHSAELAAKVGFLDAQSVGVSFSGLVYGNLGAPERGAADLERLLANNDLAADWVIMPYASLSMLYSELGEIARAGSALDAAAAASQARTYPLSDFILAFAGARLELARGQADAAFRRAGEMLEILEANGLRPFRMLAQYYRARAQEMLGRRGEAILTLEAAERESSETDRKASLWEIQSLLAHLYRARGDLAAAEVAAENARANAQYNADHAPPELRESFLNRPGVRDLMAD